MMRTTGWVACDYTTGDVLAQVAHGEIRETASDAVADNARQPNGERPYEGVRYVHTDGYLYVDEPEASA